MEYTCSDGSAIVWLEFLRRKSLLRFGYPDIATVSPAKRVQEYRLNFNGVSRVSGVDDGLVRRLRCAE